jgi:hypothetical protein
MERAYGARWQSAARDLPGSESHNGFAIHRPVFLGKDILVKT